MDHCNWQEVKEKLDKENAIIFQNYNINNLSDYEKRKIIFDYLCNNLTYDYDKLIDLYLSNLKKDLENKDKSTVYEYIEKFLKGNNIYSEELFDLIKYKISNNLINTTVDYHKDLEKVMDEHIGICNSISQYYKLLLDRNNIYSVCVICDNMLPRNHEVNLVYDKEKDSYSFDDITTVVTNKNLKELCFDYDLEDAKKINQGIRPIGYLSKNAFSEEINNSFGVIFDTNTLNYIVGREDNSHLKYGLEINNNIMLPKNIASIKKLNYKNR